MFVAYKPDCIEVFIYQGNSGIAEIMPMSVKSEENPYPEYPLWLQGHLEDESYVCDGVHMYRDIALSPGDVFMINKFGEIRYMSSQEFDRDYYIVS